MIITQGDNVLVRRNRQQEGSAIPGCERKSTDKSDNATAARAIQQMGVDLAAIKISIRRGPRVIAMRDTTYYIYELNRMINVTGTGMEWVKHRRLEEKGYNEQEKGAMRRYEGEGTTQKIRTW